MIFEIPLDHFPQPYSKTSFQFGAQARPSMPQLQFERPSLFSLYARSAPISLEISASRPQELKQMASATVSTMCQSASNVFSRFLSLQPTSWRSNS
ncbi:hypothetical protein L596_028004 [Steinernema carpocapsae]|uniref:Uncharacterized protein n=1 Tax=Steinernema carpocapsae TaxID=34508 RepID=A0A4U5LX81_STECR|nr:hypothetical protein L596_028004 [Steinernema carpocapsae]